MTQRGYPFDAGAGLAYELDWSLMARNFFGTGVILGQLNLLATYADSTGMRVKVPSGHAWLRGHYYTNDAEVLATIATAPVTNSRIDRIVLQIDYGANTIRIVVLTGVVAGSPVAPALTQNNAIWEFPLAQVLVGTGVVTITAANVTDERVFAKTEVAPQYNLLVNGGFEVWQRGAGAFTTDLAYTADRWYATKAGSSTYSITQETTIVGVGSTSSLKVVYTHNAICSIVQKLEDFKGLRGQTLTLSMWVRKGAAASLRIGISDSAGINYGVPTTSVGIWELVTVSRVIGPTVTGIFAIVDLLASDTIYLDNATLCIGSIPLQYIALTPAEDLAVCQRYYNISNIGTGFIFQGYGTASMQAYLWVPHPVVMGGAPTVTRIGTWTVTNCGQPTIATSEARGFCLSTVVTALGSFICQGGAAAYVISEWNP